MSDTPENVISTIPPLDPGGGPPSDDNLPGMQLGDYVIEKAVAWGGMGIVYRAVHPLIGRKVAVKVLRPNFASARAIFAAAGLRWWSCPSRCSSPWAR